jgi:transglutaminase/protease-like cytokinesis protein 3
VLFSKELTDTIGLMGNYQSKEYNFKKAYDTYDGKQFAYLFPVIYNNNLKLKSFATATKVVFNKALSLVFE